MFSYTVFLIVAGLLLFFLVTEFVAAVLPVVIVITMVPPEQRDDLARVLAACDHSRRLRLWPALRLAVRAQRLASTTTPRSGARM